MESIKLVTFDATNTFLKFRIPPWDYYSLIAQTYGYTVQTDVLKYRMKDSFKIMEQKHPNFGKNHITWQNWWKELVKLTFHGQLPDSANVDGIACKLIDEFKTDKCWTVADGSYKLLNILKKRGITVGVLSNFDPRLADILRNISLYNSFDFILTSYDVGYSKPDKRIFEHAMKAYKGLLKPSECLHFGDDVKKDYEGARGAGWHALLVATTNKNHHTLPPSYQVFKSIQDLCEAFEKNIVQLQ